MKLICKEILHSVKKSAILEAVIVLQFAVFFWIFLQVIGYYVNLNDNSWVQTSKRGYQYYSLTLNDAESSMEAMSNLQKDPLFIDNARTALEQIRNQDDFTYITVTKEQSYPVNADDLIRRFGGNDYRDYLQGSLYPGYYDQDFAIPPPEPYEMGGKEWITMSFCNLDWNAVKHYNLKASDGRLFEEGDFKLEEGGTQIPVMLGAAYKPFFKVGDTIEFMYFDEYTAYVIGFLEEESIIITEFSGERDAYPMTMDYDIVMPILEFAPFDFTEGHRQFVIENYTRALIGTLVMEGDASSYKAMEAQKTVNEIYRSHNLFTVIPVSASDGVYLFQSETRQSVRVVMILVLVVAIFNIFSLCLCLINKVNRNLKRYAIQLMNGQRSFRIVVAFLLEIVLVMFLAILGTVRIMWNTLYHNPKYALTLLLISIILLLVSSAILLIKVRGVNIETLMRRQES